jgi:cyanate permease
MGCGVRNLSGILAPALTGVLVDASGSYVSAFVVAGLTSVVALVGWVFVMSTVRPIDWQAVVGRGSAREVVSITRTPA